MAVKVIVPNRVRGSSLCFGAQLEYPTISKKKRLSEIILNLLGDIVASERFNNSRNEGDSWLTIF